jgi:hypothetical protein
MVGRRPRRLGELSCICRAFGKGVGIKDSVFNGFGGCAVVAGFDEYVLPGIGFDTHLAWAAPRGLFIRASDGLGVNSLSVWTCPVSTDS